MLKESISQSHPIYKFTITILLEIKFFVKKSIIIKQIIGKRILFFYFKKYEF